MPTQSKIQLVLDLDNTLICSLSTKEIKRLRRSMNKRQLEYKTMRGYYRVYLRPHLREFLDYAFKNFDVTIWTAASRDYATFIIENILMDGKKRNIKLFLYDSNCEQSQKYYDKNSPKDLRYLYNFDGYHRCNTVIVDDLIDVYNANPKQTIRAPYFDAKKEESEHDDFMLRAIDHLEKIKSNYEEKGCSFHKH